MLRTKVLTNKGQSKNTFPKEITEMDPDDRILQFVNCLLGVEHSDYLSFAMR